jgi:hypothetical protein
MINVPPITILNVKDVTTDHLQQFLQTAILSHKLPVYHPNSPIDTLSQIVPLLSIYSNNQAYVTELFNCVVSAWYEQKIMKKKKDPNWSEEDQSRLEAKKDILYRTWQVVGGQYEAASRIMTGVGVPDQRQSRH